MFRSLKALLLLMVGLTLFGMLTLGSLSMYASRSAITMLDEVNNDAVLPLTQLETIERQIKEVRFRIAGVALEQLPTVGSANHLKEMQSTLPKIWESFYSQAKQQGLPTDELDRLEKMNKGMKSLDALMSKLHKAYLADDMRTVREILEDEWPVIHAALIKPLEQFMPYYQAHVGVVFEQAQHKSRLLNWLASGLFIFGIVLVTFISWIFKNRLTRQLASAQATVSAIAKFDLSQPINITSNDEIGELLKSLSSMQNQLRHVVSQVRDGAGSLKSLSKELASSSASVADASNTQAESTSGMAASVEQLSVSVDQMREHAADSTNLAIRSGEASREGSIVARNAAHEMSTIVEGMRTSSIIVSDLGQLSTEISSIISVIKEIADQTNLLALNAAIEAARAGEQGRGFAVVADEVRKLAERTSLSTQQISDMIVRIQSGTHRAVEAMQAEVDRANHGENLARQAGEAIDQIERRAADVVKAVNDIQTALAEQSVAARDVSQRVEQIASMTETNSVASQKTSLTASEVSNLASRLSQVVSDFHL